MIRTLVAYVFCIVVSTAVLLRAFQPVAGPAVEVPDYPQASLVVAISVEDEPNETVDCYTSTDHVSVDAIQVPSRADRDRILDALGCVR
jgi:hypothetical protein